MAKTYYKYKDRGQTIDYAGISKDFSQGIMETVTGMERKADEFSEEVRKAQEQVKKDVEDRFKQKRKAEGRSVTGEGDYKIEAGDYDLPMGGERDANEVFVNLSTAASDRALEFKREYDSQKIGPNEYLRKKNALDRTFRLMKESAISMNKLADETAAGLKDGTIDPTQQLAFQELMSYNFTDPRVKIEIGADGVGYMYRVDDKGNELPRTRKSIDQYRNMSIQRYEAYDFDTNSSDIVDKLGKTLETLGRRGMTTEELLKREPIMDSVNGGTLTPMDIIDDYADGLDDDELASILMGQLGSKYSPTFNPEESVIEDASGNFTDDQSKILFVKRDLASGINKKTAQLTDEQRQRAQEFVRRDILSRFNVKPAPTTSGGDTDAKRKAQARKESLIQDVNRMRELFEGDSDLKNQVLSTYSEGLKERYNDFSSATVEGDELVIVYKDDKGYTKTDRHPLPDDFTEFVKTIGPILTGDKSLLEVLQDAEKPSGGRKKQKGSFEVEEEEYFGQPSLDAKTRQTFLDAVDVAVNKVPKGFFTRESTTFTEYGNKLRGALGGIKGLTIDVDGNGVLTMSVENLGTYPPIQLDEEAETMETVKSAVKTMLEKVQMGEMLDGSGTTEPADPAGNKLSWAEWSSQNPNGTFAEYNQYKNE